MVGGNGGDPLEAATAGVTLELYVTAPVAGTRVATIDRLTALSAEGAVEDYEVTVVRDEVILSDGGRDAGDDDDLIAALAVIASWTRGEVRSALAEERTSTRTGRAVRTLVLPERTLAVYEGDRLVGVFPCTDGDRAWTVNDFLNSYNNDGAFPPGLDFGFSTA